MKYYKTIIDGYIFTISVGSGQIEITEEEYNTIMAIILLAPEDPDGYVYKLRADTMEWDLVEFLDESEPDLNIDDTEALSILLGGEGE